MAKHDREEEDGSVLGASLLFAGTGKTFSSSSYISYASLLHTYHMHHFLINMHFNFIYLAVGAGMIALPAETVDAGFIPSVFGLSLCWIFTYVSSLVTLEASWLASSTTSSSSEKSEGSFLSIARTSLGIPGEILTAFLFYFLLTAIIVAYVSEGGSLVSQFTIEVSSINADASIGSLVFTLFFALLGVSGTSTVDNINRVFVVGLVSRFIRITNGQLKQSSSAF
jgi:tyrosine-specific transport protein